MWLETILAFYLSMLIIIVSIEIHVLKYAFKHKSLSDKMCVISMIIFFVIISPLIIIVGTLELFANVYYDATKPWFDRYGEIEKEAERRQDE